MTAFDYTALLSTAIELVAEFGDDITIIKLDRGLDDSNKPWRGKADPRATPASSVTLKAVLVPPSSASELGVSTKTLDLMKRSEAIYIVASSTDFTDYDEIVDGTGRWRIDAREQLIPGPMTLVWFFGVSK